MSLQRFLRYLANGQIVEELANTSIFRRGAQLTHYAYQKGMGKLNDVTKETKETEEHEGQNKPPNLSTFSRTFARNLHKEIEKEMKK